jgi:hypothetical protein
MGVRRTEHLEVQHVVDLDVHRIAGAARDNCVAEWVREVRATSLAGDVFFGICKPPSASEIER